MIIIKRKRFLENVHGYVILLMINVNVKKVNIKGHILQRHYWFVFVNKCNKIFVAFSMS